MSKNKKKEILIASNMETFNYGDKPYNVKTFTDASVEKSLIGYTKSILSKEDPRPDYSLFSNNVIISSFNEVIHTCSMLACKSTMGQKQTIVSTISRKISLDAFKPNNNNMIGALMRFGNFKQIFDQLKPTWEPIMNCSEVAGDTVIMFVPNVMIYLDSNYTICKPSFVDVLIVSEPNIKYLKKNYEGIDKTSEERSIIERYITDTMRSMVKLNIKSPIIFPVENAAASLDKVFSASLWNGILRESCWFEHFESMTTVLPDMENYIIFSKYTSPDTDIPLYYQS